MRHFTKYFIIILALTLSLNVRADNNEYDVFSPISKYLVQANHEALAAWFDDTLEISILSSSCDASKAQAKQIIKTFFDEHTPRNFEIQHTAGKGRSKYAIGNLTAGGVIYRVTIFVSCKDDKYFIQQFKIESL